MSPPHRLLALPLALAAAPVWLAQGAVVALRTPRLPEAAGPRCGRIGAGRLGLLILGDSAAAGVGAAHQGAALAGRLAGELADLQPRWRLEAATGATTADALARARALPADPWDIAVTVLGVNDVTRAVSLARWRQRQRELALVLAERFGIRRHYMAGVPPMAAFPALPRPLRWVLGDRAARLDAALAGVAAASPGARHLPIAPNLLDPEDMAPDGYHPGPRLYARWAALLARTIRADLTETLEPGRPT